MKLHHYVIVRNDLPRGVLAAQVIHAAGESSDRVPKGTHAVCLSARNEGELARVEERLIQGDVPHVAVREPDAPWDNALMAIGIVPMPRSNPNLRRAVSRLKLLGEEK